MRALKQELRQSVLPSWAVDNPGTLIKLMHDVHRLKINPPIESRSNGDLTLKAKKERVREDSPDHMPETEDWLAQAADLLGDVVSPHDAVREAEEEEDELLDDEWKPEFITVRPPTVLDESHRYDDTTDYPFLVNTQNMQELFRPFSFKLEALAGIRQLAPYVAFPQVAGRKRKRDEGKSACQSTPGVCHANEGQAVENINHEREAADRAGRGVMGYPLTSQQLKVVRKCCRQTTLVFTHLPSHDQIMKLIALSAQVTTPYFGHVLFPNVQKVVFKSDVRLQSILQRYASAWLGKPPAHRLTLPHPLSFALDWILDRFDACIHSPSAGVREHNIDQLASRLKSDKGQNSRDAMHVAERRWLDLDRTDDILDTASTPGLGQLTVHGIQSGTKVSFNDGVFANLHFSRHSALYSEGIQETLDSIVASTLSRSPRPYRQEQSVELYSFNALVMNRKAGPKAYQHKAELSQRLDDALKTTILQQHRKKRSGTLDSFARDMTDTYTRINVMGEGVQLDCGTCMVDCDESTCVEQIV